MNRRKRFYLLIFILTGFLVACSEQKEVVDKAPAFLDVQISIQPEQGQVNEPVTFEAKVTYGEKEVTDADSVVFEIWRSKDDNHEKIEVEHTKSGIYQLKKSFNEEGTYYIVAHVTAEDMHNMPKKEFVIGQPSEPEK
ncbi:FixH family protein [Niallia sp. XMNu-256]|uniref:FixH family protein n=1 Tax=Niallia sp. XMNu-256 TaxID=3082444 RepID=UPI0030CC37BA